MLRREVCQPTPKVHRLLPRARTAVETEARARHCLDAIPITRVTDLTPLDRLRVPVFCAVTPLALDLTTHLGKGLDAEAARTSAIMEAIERASAEKTSSPALRGSLADLRSAGRTLLDPHIFDLPEATAYSPSSPFTWIEAVDLNRGDSAWIPRDLVTNPPQEGVLRSVDTNGLAAGNNLLEAVLHGVCEVIERDAVGQHLFFDLFGDPNDPGPIRRRIDPRSFPDTAARLVSQIEEPGYDVVVQDLTTEIGVATFRAALIDPVFPTRFGVSVRRFAGYGTDPCAELALLRSLTEAVQSRLAVVQGARDSFNGLPESRRPSTRHAYVDDFRAGPTTSFSEVPSFESNDLAEDLALVLSRLDRAGFDRTLAVNLTREEWGIPVVRVRVPGLTSFLVNQRRPGWRCLRYLL